jgi:hypothetical protein
MALMFLLRNTGYQIEQGKSADHQYKARQVSLPPEKSKAS